MKHVQFSNKPQMHKPNATVTKGFFAKKKGVAHQNVFLYS